MQKPAAPADKLCRKGISKGTMTSRERLAAAEKATSAALKQIYRAQDKLEEARTTNAAGIFYSPLATRAAIDSAAAAIETALKTIAATDWPTDADYDTL